MNKKKSQKLCESILIGFIFIQRVKVDPHRPSQFMSLRLTSCRVVQKTLFNHTSKKNIGATAWNQEAGIVSCIHQHFVKLSRWYLYSPRHHATGQWAFYPGWRDINVTVEFAAVRWCRIAKASDDQKVQFIGKHHFYPVRLSLAVVLKLLQLAMFAKAMC